MDINLSEDKDYFYIIDEIKKEIKLRTALIIIITKKYNEDDVVSGLEKGACDYVKKPVGHDEPACKIEKQLRLDFIVFKFIKYILIICFLLNSLYNKIIKN